MRPIDNNSKQDNPKNHGADVNKRHGPGATGSSFQAEEFVGEYDQEAVTPEESEGMTSSSSPGQSLHRTEQAPTKSQPSQPGRK